MSWILAVVAVAFTSIEPWTPPQLEGLMRADEIRATLTASTVSCDSAPELTDLAVLIALLALRTVSERMHSGRS